jgi:hypothetical protein
MVRRATHGSFQHAGSGQGGHGLQHLRCYCVKGIFNFSQALACSSAMPPSKTAHLPITKASPYRLLMIWLFRFSPYRLLMIWLLLVAVMWMPMVVMMWVDTSAPMLLMALMLSVGHAVGVIVDGVVVVVCHASLAFVTNTP